jgi:hypothetical protein
MLVERVMATVRAIVEPDPISRRFGHLDDVRRDLGVGGCVALTVRPPTVRVRRRVGWGEAGYNNERANDDMFGQRARLGNIGYDSYTRRCGRHSQKSPFKVPLTEMFGANLFTSATAFANSSAAS